MIVHYSFMFAEGLNSDVQMQVLLPCLTMLVEAEQIAKSADMTILSAPQRSSPP